MVAILGLQHRVTTLGLQCYGYNVRVTMLGLYAREYMYLNRGFVICASKIDLKVGPTVGTILLSTHNEVFPASC